MSEFFDFLTNVKSSRSELQNKIAVAQTALKAASDVVSDLEEELTSGIVRVEVLKEKADHYAKLAEAKEEQVTALLAEMEAMMHKGRGKERWIALGLNLLAGLLIFTLGVLVGPLIKRLLGISP